ncbi:MAG: DMT family transporter, partial [Gammaproteobacteria bacterium]|nr:DMT family transporter [Gammaproteobacteria bacterium]
MRNHITDYLLLLLLALMWSASFTLIKVGVATIGPVTLTAARMTVAAAALAVCLAIRRTGIPLHRRAVLLYLVVGFMGNTLPFILIGWGETRIDSSLAAIMMGVMPITTFVLAHYFVPDEPMTARKVFGICLGFGGLLTLVGWSALAG